MQQQGVAAVLAAILSLNSCVEVTALAATRAGALTRRAGLLLHRRPEVAFVEASATASLAQRQREVEEFAAAEKNALSAQQEALEEIVAQQASLAAHEEALEAQQNLTASRVENILALGSMGFVRSGVLEQLLAGLVYVTFLLIVGQLYGRHCTYEYPALFRRPEVSGGTFSFGLFDGFNLDPDWRICLFSCCCQPVRWADTASNLRIRFVHFWPGIVIFGSLCALSGLTWGVTALVLLLVVVQNRQRIREVYGLPHGSFETVCLDCMAWSFCGPCATMQEAMEVEFVDPPLLQALGQVPMK